MQKKANKYYELKDRYQNLLYKISFDIVKNHLRAERVVAKSLESLSRHLGTFDNAESFRTAYLAVMLTKYIAQGQEDILTDANADVYSETDEFKFFEVDTYSIVRALENLPERYSFYLVLKYEFGFDNKGMADLLNTHPANIRSELCRATNALNKALDDLALSGAKIDQNAKDSVCAVLPSFVNNLGASFLNIDCEPVEFSEEFEEVAVYTPPAKKPREDQSGYTMSVIYFVLFILFGIMIYINPDLFTDIGLVKPESKVSSSFKTTSVTTTSEPFVFTPIRPTYIPSGYKLVEEKTTDNLYCARYVRTISNLNHRELTITQKLYDPEYYDQIKQYSPKYLRDFPHYDTIYYEKDGTGVVFFHYKGYTFIITFDPVELDDIMWLTNSINTRRR